MRFSPQTGCWKIVFCFMFAATGWTAADDQSSNRLVTYEKGDLPIILSAPHGGRAAIPGVTKRQGEGVASFKTVTDTNTDLLTEKLADALEEKLGKRPYLVIARFQRKHADANRSAKNAYESEYAKTIYDEYHQSLENAREDITNKWGHGLLLDIHGQSAEPKAIIRGTQNGKTVKHLIGRFGEAALYSETSLFGQFAKQGIPVNPVVDSPDLEHPAFDGGYIVRTYGSQSGGTVDAIQLELGRELRAPYANSATADKLATAIIAYASQYLPEVAAKEMVSLGKTVSSDGFADKDRIRVGVYNDVGVGRSVNELLFALGKFQGLSVKQLKADDIRAGELADYDILFHPGGSGSKQGRHLENEGREEIREFVRQGGGYIGICAGAYLASAHYDWSLNILDAKVVDTKHWARGHGDVKIGITDAGRKMLKTDASQMTIMYWQGPLYAPANRPDIEDYETIATFDTEIAQNGAPKGVMLGTTAIAKGNFGNGKVVCFSPHPEKTKGLEHLVKHAIEHVTD